MSSDGSGFAIEPDTDEAGTGTPLDEPSADADRRRRRIVARAIEQDLPQGDRLRQAHLRRRWQTAPRT